MKRPGSSDSPGALMSFCPATDEQSPRSNHVYSRDFQSMLDGLDEDPCAEEETGRVSEKKRRLSVNQVKALEKNFEVENKLEPERKMKLAQELGLQPRQVAVWFQNRRARWKTKQLERDYGVLKAKYDALERNYESLRHDNEALLKEIKELKSKLNEENRESNASIKEEAAMVSESEEVTATKHFEPAANTTLKTRLAGSDPGLNGNSLKTQTSSDSDSSAILNEGNSPNNNNNSNHNAANSSPEFLHHHNNNNNNHHHHQLFISSSPPPSSSFRFSSSSPSSIGCISFTGSRDVFGSVPLKQLGGAAAYHPQFDKLIEHDFFSGEEACVLFSDEQAPSLHWYCPPDHESELNRCW